VLRFSVRAALLAVAALFVFVGSSAGRESASQSAPWVSDGLGAPLVNSLAQDEQHGGPGQHLPAARDNIELVGKLEVNTPEAFRFDPVSGDPDPSEPQVVPGQIADLSVYKNTAYLDSWSEPSCRRGGFFSVDISDPANPQQLAFVPALPETYHGEGAHTITLSTDSFSGDVLAVNNEPCGVNGVGGFDLYDVSDPANPEILVQGAGDQSPDTPDDSPFADTTQDPAEVPNSAHSIFIWQDGPKAYAVIVDNTELHDVDIFDITDPRNPVFIADVDLVLLGDAQGKDIIANSANGDAIFHHDMVVKEIDGVQTMLVSYWDAGYVKLNVDDPSNPVIIGDSDFDDQDPLVTDPVTGEGFERPEGNAHQSEFSHDNKFVLAADEDFSTYRLPRFNITTESHTGEYPAGEFGFTKPMATLEDNTLNGPTVFGGYGCDADNDIPVAPAGMTLEPGEESIVVLSRGPQDADADPSAPYPACTFQEKAENAAEKGWDAVIIGNHHAGAANGADPDASLCGSGTGADIIGVCLGHRAMHLLFDDPPGAPGPGKRPPDYSVPYDNTKEPQVGDLGAKISTESVFDGWGYTHLYRNNAGGDLEAVDHFAIPEALDESFATGFGTLSVHEFATDPTEYIAYSAYYAGGMRVFRFGDGGLDQVGKFIDEGGNDFWGVEQFTTPQGDRLFAGSDRDFGLYVFRYTGPGAAVKPACSDVTAMVPFKGSAAVPLSCSDANGNPLSRSIVDGPDNGTVSGDANSGSVTYTHTGSGLGSESFTFKANDGAADSNVATANLVVVASDGGRCFNPFAGTEAGELIVGSEFGDGISGQGGDDSIAGRGGDDCLFGEGGADEVSGSAGSDRVQGGPGGDDVAGGTGDDRVFGGAGDDDVSGGVGADGMSGGAGGDDMSGGGGRDRMSGGSGGDDMSGRAGNDRMRGGGGRDSISGGGGNDRIFVRRGSIDTVDCGGGFDRVRAGRRDRVATDCESVRRRGRR
jgi:Bacterial Ig domain/RTX calcium-binding nonapeptide repeat (4 copies)